MATIPAFRCANDPKDFSLWDAHKDTFRRLFLSEGKSLGEVKTAMEESGFPETNVKTYEVVLREHFKFRKNLEAGQWLLVGQELDKWKSQGLDPAVSLSGIVQDPRLVDKKIRRERAEAARGKLKYSKSQRFPDAVAIIPNVSCTLEVPGSMPYNTIGLLEPLFSLPQELESASTNLFSLISLSDPRLSQRQLSHDARVVGLQADFVEHILHNPIGKVYEILRKNVPFRELICLLFGLWETQKTSPGEASILANNLYGFISLARNIPSLKNYRHPGPRLFGLNDSRLMLETMCTSLCNGFVLRLDRALIPIIRKWLATVADIGVLQQFFAIQKPAAAAMWGQLIKTFYIDQSVYSILVEVALRVRNGEWLHRNKREYLKYAILNGDSRTAECLVNSFQADARTIESFFPLGMETYYHLDIACVPLVVRLFSKLHVSQKVLDTTLAALLCTPGLHQAAAVHWLVEEGTKMQPVIFDWIPPYAQQLPLGWKPVENTIRMTLFHSEEPFGGKDVPKATCKDIFGAVLPVLGILASARGGREALRRFMSSLSADGPPGREQLLRLALCETTLQHDVQQTNLLLETGIFHNMEPFRMHRSKRSFGRRELSDPVFLSAMMLDTEMIQILLRHTLFENYRSSDILQATILRCPSDWKFKARPIIDFLVEREGNSLKKLWDEVLELEGPVSQDLVLDYVHRRISRQRGPYLEPRDLLCTIFPHDTLRKTIKHGFNVDVVESLVASGIHVPPDEAGEENTLLIDALLTHSKDRYKIVHFLLRNGSDPRISSSNLTVLEATLSIESGVKWEWNPATDDKKVTMDLFRELSKLGAPFKRETPSISSPPLPLLAMLIREHAGIPLLQQAVSGGAQINDCWTHPCRSPLQTAVCKGDLGIVKWLLEQGAEVNEPLRREYLEKNPRSKNTIYVSFTALGAAIRDGNMDMVTLLLSHGALINAPSTGFINTPSKGLVDHMGMRLHNPVDSAAFYNELDILKVLVDSGGQSAYPGLSGLDGAFWQAHRNYPGIIMFLEQYTGRSVGSVIASMGERLGPGELW